MALKAFRPSRRATDQTAPVSRLCRSIACDIRRVTRPLRSFPSRSKPFQPSTPAHAREAH
jgi:hypothetical protein